jgi:para-aminobenzoate synthetase
MAYLSFLRMTTVFLTLLTFSIGFYSRPARSSRDSSSKWRDSRLQMRTLLIDNFDSYTYNIWQLLSEVNGEEPIVVYNNAFNYNWDELLLKVPEFDNIVLSPGPGSPDIFSDFGICSDAILRSNMPVLGVCLGHQGIANSFGGIVHRAKTPMHGRLSSISHSNEGLFRNIPQDSKVVRYHSLTVDSDSLPPELRATAWTADNVMMGLEHVSKPIYGVQFHPESISTACGKQLFSNFRDITEKFHHDVLMNKKESSLDVKSSGINMKKSKNIPMTGTSIKHDRNIIITRKRFSTPVDVKSVFREIYGESSASFWLDSSSSGPVQGRSDKTTPLSIFGDLDSSETAYAVEYHGSNQLTKRSPRQRVIERFNMNIFQYLDAELEKSKALADVIHYCEEPGPDAGSRIFQQNLQSGQNLPFNMTSAYFGFLGYEARHEATEILTRPYKDTYEKYDLAATHRGGFESSKWVENLTHPMAFFMHPTQYVVFDHADNSVYVVSLAEEGTGIDSGKISSLGLLDKITSIISTTAAASMELQTLIPRSPFDISESDSVQFSGSSNSSSSSSSSNSSSSSSSNSSSSNSSSNTLYAVKSKEEYRSDIHKCLEYIKAGESYEICLTLQFKGDSANSEGVRPKPLDVYESLRSKNPAPYSCFLHYDPVLFMTPTQPPSLVTSKLLSDDPTERDSTVATPPSTPSAPSAPSPSLSPSPERPCDVDPTLGWCLPGGFTICSSSPERYLKASKVINVPLVLSYSLVLFFNMLFSFVVFYIFHQSSFFLTIALIRIHSLLVLCSVAEQIPVILPFYSLIVFFDILTFSRRIAEFSKYNFILDIDRILPHPHHCFPGGYYRIEAHQRYFS